jgi:outer membrane lipoprotein-sorting protein
LPKLGASASRVLRGFPKKEFTEDYTDVLMGLDDQFNVRRLVVDLPDHTRMEFRFDHIDRNPPLDKSLFRFAPPPGTEVIDEK